MTIHQIECFVHAAREGSMSKAGEILYMTPQAVSRQVKALEEELGFSLFIRHNLGVRLSEEGNILFEYWDQMLYEHMRTIDRARDVHKKEQQKLMIGMEDIGNITYDLMRKLADYNEKNPELDIHFDILPTKTLISYLDQGKLDIIIAFTSEFEEVKDLHLLTIDSNAVKVSFCVSKYHPIARKKKLTKEDFKGLTFGTLSKEVSNDYYNRVLQWLEREGLKSEVKVKEYDSRQNMELALVSRKCVVITNDVMFAHQADKLKFYPLDEKLKFSGISMAWKDNKYEIKARQIHEHFKLSKKGTV